MSLKSPGSRTRLAWRQSQVPEVPDAGVAGSRVAPGSQLPGAPTDPDVRD